MKTFRVQRIEIWETLWRVWGPVKPALAAFPCRNEELFSP
jgi:hypothetical protein